MYPDHEWCEKFHIQPSCWIAGFISSHEEENVNDVTKTVRVRYMG